MATNISEILGTFEYGLTLQLQELKQEIIGNLNNNPQDLLHIIDTKFENLFETVKIEMSALKYSLAGIGITHFPNEPSCSYDNSESEELTKARIIIKLQNLTHQIGEHINRRIADAELNLNLKK